MQIPLGSFTEQGGEKINNRPEIDMDEPVYVSQYRRLTRYGGPEEGGWWLAIGHYTGQSFGPFPRSEAMKVQKAAKEAAYVASGRIRQHQDRMIDIYYNLEVTKGEHHETWDDVPSEAYVYS